MVVDGVDIRAVLTGLLLFLFIQLGCVFVDATFITAVSGSVLGTYAEWVVYGGTAICGGVTAYISKRGKVYNSFLLGIAIPISVGFLIFVLPYTGFAVDNVGAYGAYFMAVVFLPISIFLCTAAGALVTWVRHAALK